MKKNCKKNNNIRRKKDCKEYLPLKIVTDLMKCCHAFLKQCRLCVFKKSLSDILTLLLMDKKCEFQTDLPTYLRTKLIIEKLRF